jgi:hypothetical protein
MDQHPQQGYTAFEGSRCIASGKLREVLKKTKEILDQDTVQAVNIFDDFTGEIVEVDFRGTIDDVLQKLAGSATANDSQAADLTADHTLQRGPGRPKLGVVAREVTLLPRHWQWLNSQPGGASVALRKLVEEARRVNAERDKIRHAQEVVYRFMHAMTGDMPGFEEATRALFAGDPQRFSEHINPWPADIRNYIDKLAEAAFAGKSDGMTTLKNTQ